jgi:RNA polymerase sigma-70 factor (ECF subfamily)
VEASQRPLAAQPGEADLVERAKGNPQAFGILYDLYFPIIYRFVYTRLQAQAPTEDVTAEVFFKALKNLTRYRDTGRPFSCWLYQIASNAVNDHYRGRRGDLALDDALQAESGSTPVIDQVVARDRGRRVWLAIDQLPDRQRTAMVLRFGEDLSLQDIARVMGKSVGAIKLLLYRAVRQLRHELRLEEACV